MARRRVTATGKDSDGDITKLCNSGESWSPRSKAHAINDINGGQAYYTRDSQGREAEVRVVNQGGKQYLRTTQDKSDDNNLDNLPDC
ncbi:DUF3892 domain-containing protein [Kushneria aurantia]|uniref:DUF3892 domain-containing protein n=1 Tax=Kushneria aurantia TaxID=504092 RepID=A0ABV6G4Y0_9GAMM